MDIPQNKEQLKEYLFERRIINKETGCWIYLFRIGSDGKSRIRYKNRSHILPRLSAYLFLNLDLDNEYEFACHKLECKDPGCWNPEHLYVGSAASNSQDTIDAGNNYNKEKTHCINGHRFTEKNTYIRPNGSRTCRKCNKLITRKRRNNK